MTRYTWNDPTDDNNVDLEEAFNHIKDETKSLCNQVQVLETLENLLNNYIWYTENITYSRRLQKLLAKVPLIGELVTSQKSNTITISRSMTQIQLDKLLLITTQVPAEINSQNRPELMHQLRIMESELNVIKSEVEGKISKICIMLADAAHPAKLKSKLLESQISKFHHPEIKEEAKTYLDVINQLATSLDTQIISSERGSLLYSEPQVIISTLRLLEEHRSNFEKLLRKDANQRHLTVAAMIIYIGLISLAIVTLSKTFDLENQFFLGRTPMNEFMVPIISVPWPVIAWSLIGSFTAMIYRFNNYPIHKFNDSVKWMVTRPIQGIFLGSIFYLILVSGLFILTGNSTLPSSNTGIADAVILVLSFLIGFSDRFADSVFNALVERFSTGNSNPDNKSKIQN